MIGYVRVLGIASVFGLVALGGAAAEPVSLLGVTESVQAEEEAGCGPTGGQGQGQGAGGSGPLAPPTHAEAIRRFLKLIRDGEKLYNRYSKAHALDRTNKPLRRALACFEQAIALRVSAKILRTEVGAALHLPELDLGIAHFYLGNRKLALRALDPVRQQGDPTTVSAVDAEHIKAQRNKATSLRNRLMEPFLASVVPVAQKSSNTCGSTGVYVALRGLGIAAPLDRLEACRAHHKGELARIAQDGVDIAGEAGIAIHAADTEHPTGADPEIGFPTGVTLEGVRDVISRGYPVVLAVRGYTKPESGAYHWANGHYVTAIGVKTDGEGRITHVYTVDSDTGVNRRFERAELQAIWQANTLGAIVLTPKDPRLRWQARTRVSWIRQGEAGARTWVGIGLGAPRAD